MPIKFCTYDLECYKRVFTASFIDNETGKRKEFCVFDSTDDLLPLVKFVRLLKKNKYTLVGFNSLNYDVQILEFVVENAESWLQVGYGAQDIVGFIHNQSNYIIHLDEEIKFKVLIPESKCNVPQIDLRKQKHYDGKAKAGVSLKWLQFTMRYPNIAETPIPFDAELTKDDVRSILDYNWNDVDSTAEFFKRNKFETELRATLSEKYGLPLMNASEPRLAKMIFAKFLCDEMKIKYFDLKDMRTFRKQVRLKDVILPYIKFETPELNAVLDKIKATTVNPNEKAEFEVEFDYGGIHTVVGLGGIHACCKPGVYEAREDLIIEDIDVVSYYPNLAIENGLRPYHLGPVFNKVYKNIFDERVKIPKKDPINYVYKIILNSTYGLSKEKNSYLYDPFFTYSITINGQLSILMLVERLVRSVPGLKIFQENTDGVTIGYHPMYRDVVAAVCKEWCELTKLKLEQAFYSKMVIRDVNNYIATKATYTDDKGEVVKGFDWNEYQEHIASGKKRSDYGKVKHKGTFEVEMDYHKNPSFLVVPMAVEAHFLGGVSYRDFILQHNNIYDFCGAVKKKSDFEIKLHRFIGGEHHQERQQKVTRYYVAKKGGKMAKHFHGGKKAGSVVGIEAGWLVEPLNTIVDDAAHNYDINRSYYIKEAEKLIYSIETARNQLTLF